MSKILIAFGLSEARLGNLGPLIARVLSGASLTKDERQFIATALEGLDGRRGKSELRRIEKTLIGERVEELAEKFGSKEAAVTHVAKERGRKRSTVFAASKMSKKPI